MSTDELTRQLQQLTLQEATLRTQLTTTTTEIERVRQQILRHAKNTNEQTGSRNIQVGDRIRVLNPTKLRTPQTKQWRENEQRGTVTGITSDSKSPLDTTRYHYITDNGTKTWRKAHNIQLL
ncbi:MAG: hypothetical protein ACRCT2_00745 [Plesiomonas shigelloides]